MGLDLWACAHLHRANQRVLFARVYSSIDILVETRDEGVLRWNPESVTSPTAAMESRFSLIDFTNEGRARLDTEAQKEFDAALQLDSSLKAALQKSIEHIKKMFDHFALRW